MSSRRMRSRLTRRTQNPSNDSSNTNDDIAACIDLTVDIGGDEVIDLTQFNSNIMETPVVILSPMGGVGPIRRRRGSGRRGMRRSRSNRRRITISPELVPPPSSETSIPSSSGRVELDSSDEELPDIPFDIPQQSKQANASFVKSPSLSIACPVCLDDLKQLKSNKKKIMSTVCGHIFCQDCITNAIKTFRSCPTCRKSLTQSKIHPLFL